MKLKISNQQVSIIEPLVLVADTENVYECEYVFDEEWDGFNKTAVFEGCGNTYQVVLTNTQKCKIPNEVIADSGYARFGVLGTKVEGSITLRYPTVWSERVWVDVASVGTGTPQPPTAEVYAQILANEGAIEDRLDDAEDAIEALDGRLDTAESDIDALESGKVDKVEGKGLSTNDYTDNEKSKVADAYAKRHEHSNKEILDTISQVLVTAWNNCVTWIADNGSNILSHLSNTTVHTTSAEKSTWNAKQNHLTAGQNITIVNDVISSSGGGGTSDYTDLSNKPKINNVELSGNKSTSDLGINIPTKTSDLTNDSGFIDSSYHDSSKADATSVYTKSEIDTTVSSLQPKTDNLLSTVSKNVVGAINELDGGAINIWDEEWEYGEISSSTGQKVSGYRLCSKNFIPVTENTYNYFCVNTGIDIRVFRYDENKNFLGVGGWMYGGTFSIPSGTSYIKFHTATGYGNTYKHDICINVSSRIDGQYYPYKTLDDINDIANKISGIGTLQESMPSMGLSHNDYTNADATWVRMQSATAKLIRTVNVTESVTNFDINVDDDGNDFCLDGVIIDLSQPNATGQLVTFCNTKTYGQNKWLTLYADASAYTRYTAERLFGIWQMLSYGTGGSSYKVGCTNDAHIKPYTVNEFDGIRCIRFRQTLSAGTTIKVYGVPKTSPVNLRIMQYNIGKFNWGVAGGLATDVATKIANYQSMLTDIAPDIICLEEYTDYVDNQSVYNSDVSIFDGFFPNKYHYNDELAIKSKTAYPLSNTNHFHVYGTDGSTENFAGTFHIATVNVNGKSIAIVGGYLNVMTTPAYRANGLKQLLTTLNSYENVIVAFDSNMTSETELRTMIETLRTNSIVATNGGQFGSIQTYNLKWNGYKIIDNVLVKGNIQIRNAFRVNKYNELSSDHYPWVADITII